MKADEIKLRMRSWADRMIDRIIPGDGFIDKIKNSTAHLWVEQNVGRLDPLIKVFENTSGDIDIPKILGHYRETLFVKGDLRLDLRSLVPEEYDFLRTMIPGKIIILKAEDLSEIFER